MKADTHAWITPGRHTTARLMRPHNAPPPLPPHATQVQSLQAGAKSVGAAPGDAFIVHYQGFLPALRAVTAESGFGGFWRGLGPRVAMFGPSCAVSWVAYESIKNMLSRGRV